VGEFLQGLRHDDTVGEFLQGLRHDDTVNTLVIIIINARQDHGQNVQK